MTKHQLAILTTHPIQYQIPWFRLLANHPQLDLEVLYCHNATPADQAGAGFGVDFRWDVSLLDGYRHRFLKNVAPQPSLRGFRGLDTPEIADVIRQGGYNAVLLNGWHYRSAWQAMRACWRTGTPVMARSDSHLRTRRPPVKRAAKWPLYRWFISKLDACLPVGQWSRDYFLHYGARPDRIFFVPHVVDTDLFSSKSLASPEERLRLRRSWQLDEAAIVFLFAGKFTSNKRPMHFVESLAGAVSSAAPVAGLMVGDGPLRRECEDFARANDLPISFTGFLNQSEMPSAYFASDALVLPSEEETWGVAVTEAMSCGKPCFVSDSVGCSPDLIVPNVTGEIFSLQQPEALKNIMIRYGRNPAALNEMSRNVLQSPVTHAVDMAVAGVVEALSKVRTESR
jgi:glycosyltransferase involved in cell wall biosynthesis